MKILVVVGARPQFIKAATVSRSLRRPEFAGLSEVIVHTGQHYDPSLSAAFFDELAIPPPAYHLGVGSASHGAQTGAMMARLEEVVARERPGWVLVYGDTNSTLAGALVAAKASVPLAHVEAGLRSFRRGMPEEVNRIVTDRLSDLLFCPTEASVANLRAEGRDDGIHLVGDVMYDSFLYFREQVNGARVLRQLSIGGGAYILASVHRAENTDDPGRLSTVISGLGLIAQRVSVVLPLHPRTAKALDSAGITLPEGVRAIEPVSYLAMIGLLLNAAAVATDSGGLQKEAFFAGVPCVTLREETEWVETVETGWNRLAPLTEEGIEAALSAALEQKRKRAPPSLYGDGDAAGRIVRILAEAT